MLALKQSCSRDQTEQRTETVVHVKAGAEKPNVLCALVFCGPHGGSTGFNTLTRTHQ